MTIREQLKQLVSDEVVNVQTIIDGLSDKIQTRVGKLPVIGDALAGWVMDFDRSTDSEIAQLKTEALAEVDRICDAAGIP